MSFDCVSGNRPLCAAKVTSSFGCKLLPNLSDFCNLLLKNYSNFLFYALICSKALSLWSSKSVVTMLWARKKLHRCKCLEFYPELYACMQI